MTLPILHLGPLGLGLVAAIVFDLRRRRIPNAISAFVFLAGLVVRTIDQGVGSALSGVGAAALVVAALYRPWLMGGIGGGDVKLAGATAAWISFGRLPWFGLSGAAAGGLFAVIYYFRARAPAKAEIRANLTLTVLQNELPTVPSHRSGHLSLPYSLAIAAGAAIVFLYVP
jgi:Flp pilus assembly protein protease CpaA